MYWKETVNFKNGCSAHITGSSYAGGNLALPDQSTFIIEDTLFGDGVSFEANHHCNVGTTGGKYSFKPDFTSISLLTLSISSLPTAIHLS